MIESYKDTNQITSPDKFEEDVLVEQTLRPSCFDDFIGQQDTVENLKVYIEAAAQRDEALDHVLLFECIYSGDFCLGDQKWTFSAKHIFSYVILIQMASVV